MHFRPLSTTEIHDLVGCQMLRVAEIVEVFGLRVRIPLSGTDQVSLKSNGVNLFLRSSWSYPIAGISPQSPTNAIITSELAVDQSTSVLPSMTTSLLPPASLLTKIG